MSVNLVLNTSYLTATGKTVKMVKTFLPGEPDYEQGFRFRGDDDYSYREDGGIDGNIGAGQIKQMGAEPLVGVAQIDLASDVRVDRIMEETTVRAAESGGIRIGRYYRNGMGAVIKIVKEVDPSTNRYKSGYRWIDHRNTFYTAEGSVKSRAFKTLDLKAEVTSTDVTHGELKTLVEEGVAAVKTSVTTQTSEKIARAGTGAVIGIGIVQVAVFAMTGSFLG